MACIVTETLPVSSWRWRSAAGPAGSYGLERSCSSCLRRSPRRPSQARRREQGERADDHERVEDDHRLDREDLDGPVDRVVEARRHGRHGRRLRRLQGQLDRRVARLGVHLRARDPHLCELAAGGVAAGLERRPRLGVEVGAASLAERRAICSRSAVSRFVSSSTCPWRSSICTCCADDLAEAREPHDRVLDVRGRHLQGQRRDARVRRRVRRRDEVAAEIARDPQRLLGRARRARRCPSPTASAGPSSAAPGPSSGAGVAASAAAAPGLELRRGSAGGAEAVPRSPGRAPIARRSAGAEPESSSPATPATPSSTTAVAGTATSAKRLGEKRARREGRRPPRRLGGGDRPDTVAQRAVGGGPGGLQLGDQLSGGHRSSPSLRVWSAPG